MGTARENHNANILATGKVLITGGSDPSGSVLASAELYDPATGTFTPTGSMGTSRQLYLSTLLPSGKVLVAGGSTSGGGILASAELYDPTTGTFSPTGSMGTARVQIANPTNLLPNGKVLIAGGVTSGGVFLASAELYDPATGTFSPTGSMGTARLAYALALLPTGKVLIAGGYNSSGSLASAELYTPTAVQPPAGCPPSGQDECEQENGEGEVDEGSGQAGDFNFTMFRDVTTQQISGSLLFFNQANGAMVQGMAFTSMVTIGNTGTFAGICTMNGVPCIFTVSVTGNRMPSTYDTFAISVNAGPAIGGYLKSGNIQVFPSFP
jgi:Kelch motif protein/galactose oxidase-like protein